MPRKRKSKPTDVPDAVLEYFAGPTRIMTAPEVEEAMRRFKKALLEKALGAELTHHLGYAPGASRPDTTSNHRNGTTAKTVLTDDGTVDLAVPRDRAGTFEPVLIPKHERRFTGFDDKILALYARGLTVREIQGYLRELYAVDVSPDLISTVTDAVIEEITAWQTRPLDRVYAVVFFDGLRVKIRDEGSVRIKAVYLALGVRTDGRREILGLWIEQTEGAKFWLKVFTDLRARGCEDILIAVTDGLKGMPEALEAAYPRTTLQTCIVHLIRHSLEYASWKDRKPLAAALKTVYRAPTEAEALAALDALEATSLGQRFPTVLAAWRRAWTHVVPFFAFPPEIRRVLYTTNALENVHRQLRKIIKTRGHFPNDDAATKLLWLALRNITLKWQKSGAGWDAALNHFAILYGDRFTRET
jgi:transposase-like protein